MPRGRSAGQLIMPGSISAEFLALQTSLAGRYSLERELGRGGMGIVFLAHEVALDRPVALKLLPPELAAQDEVRTLFLTEARTAAKLSHPNIVPIFAVDEVDGFVFFVMAFIDGQTLGERVRARGPLSEADATRVLREVAWALAHAHLQGVVHRDVKPDNILLEEGTGRALVSDFGIALVGADPAPDGESRVLGTAEFMSPEQATGAAVDARSDLYSLGALGFYMVSGRVPFEGSSAAVVLGKHVSEPPPPVASKAPQVSASLARVIDRCLRKEPDERFPGGEAIADALGQQAGADRPLPVPLRVFIKHIRESSQASAGIAVVFLLVVLPLLVAGVATGDLLSVAFAGGIVAVLVGGFVGTLAFRARKLLKAGHTPEDARLALQQDVIRRNEEFRFDVGPRTTVVDRFVTRLMTGAFGGAGLMLGAIWLLPDLSDTLWSLFSLGLFTGLGSVLYREGRARGRADLIGERWLRIWGGRVGDWLFKLGGVGLKAPAAIGAGAYRPTEMAIGFAVAKLFEELPKETRRTLTGLPETVKKLEGDARSLRADIAELNSVLAEIGDDPAAAGSEARAQVRAEVETTREEADRRLREVVTALETIRVGLLRMHAGEGVLQSVTMELAAAGDLSHDMADLLEGHREVERLLSERRATGVFTLPEE